MNEVYIHYGHAFFDVKKFAAITNRPYFKKPYGGFWASPIDAKYGWREWSADSNYRNCEDANSFRFTLRDCAKVFHIRSEEDVLKMPAEKSDIKLYEHLPDFEKMAKEYDAIELHLSEEVDKKPGEGLYFALYGWDCDSILILNPDIICPL